MPILCKYAWFTGCARLCVVCVCVVDCLCVYETVPMYMCIA